MSTNESIHGPAITSNNRSLYLRLLFNELLLYPIYNRKVAFTQEIEHIENLAVLNKYSAGSRLSLTMCCLVMLSSIGESNWEWELQLAHSEILIMFQITRGPEGDVKYRVCALDYWTENPLVIEFSKQQPPPRWSLWVRIVNLVAQSQSRRMIASSSNLRFDLWLQKSTSTDTLLLLLIHQPLIWISISIAQSLSLP